MIEAGDAESHGGFDRRVAANDEDVACTFAAREWPAFDPQRAIFAFSCDQNIHAQIGSQQRTRFIVETDKECDDAVADRRIDPRDAPPEIRIVDLDVDWQA